MSNTIEKYSVSQYSVSSVLSFIDSGDIAIPEIQRPFVWKGRQVRDLIDSLYNGYPTGYLIVWLNPDVKLKNGGSSIGKKILIDGQQRVTALMTAIGGYAVLNEDYEQKQIAIAFNPLAKGEEERFAVRTPAHDKSSFWIPDISVIFRNDFDSFGFINDYTTKNPGVISPQELNQSLNRLINIKNCQLGVITLVPQLDISEVTEIFVRINSQGKRLNEADFAMSKIAADERFGGNLLRKAIDYFCHLAVDPAFYSQLSSKDHEFMNSVYADKLKWLKDDYDNIYDPDYNDMLRVSFMHKFGRGKLGDLVSLLSGRDFAERTFKEDIAQDSFERLTKGVINFMNQYTFEQFVVAIKAAGFINPKLLNSKMTLDFAYTVYLLLNNNAEVSKVEIKPFVPSLTALKCNDVKDLNGVKVSNVKVTVTNKSGDSNSEVGEVLFKDRGLSGIVVFNLSTIFARSGEYKGSVEIDLMPNLSIDDLCKKLAKRKLLNCNLDKFFVGMFVNSLANEIFRQCKMNTNIKSNKLTDEQILILAKTIKNLKYNVVDAYDNNQVFSGGVKLDDLSDSLEHKQIPNLYFTGEICDIDGVCGGYNLQWAFTSGKIVGDSL